MIRWFENGECSFHYRERHEEGIRDSGSVAGTSTRTHTRRTLTSTVHLTPATPSTIRSQ